MPLLSDQRYTVVASAFTIQGVMIGTLFAYGVLFKDLETELGWSRTLLSASFSVCFVVTGVCGVLAGRLNDRLGPRVVMTVSGISFGLGYAGLYFVSAPWHLFALYGVLVGIGMSTHDVVTLSTVARWFDRRRGLMTGVVKVGTACGQMTIPVLTSVLMVTLGWRLTCAVMGLAALVILLIAAQGLRRSPQAAAAPAGAGGSTSPASGTGELGASFADAVRSRPFWTFCAVQFCFLPTLVTIPVHIVPHAMDLGMSAGRAATILTVVGAASVIGRLSIGACADRLGGRVAMMLCLVVLITSLAALPFIGEASLLFAFAAVYGIAHGGLFTVVSLVVAEYFGTVSHGALFGAVLFFGTLGGAVGPLLAGQSFDALGSYDMAFFTLTALGLLALVLVASLPGRTAQAMSR